MDYRDATRRDAAQSACLLAALHATTLLLLSACGGTPEPASTTGGPGSTAGSVTTASAALGPGDLGDKIGAVYVAALRDVALALKDKPDVAGVRAQVEKLKNDAISKLIESGRAREAMTTADRAKVDAKITAALTAAGAEDWYATYNEAWTHYSGIDSDFANLVAAFNVIGQYANFDLLKEQLPDEAARLGVK